MTFSSLTTSAMTTSRLQTSVKNLQSQLKIERFFSLSKDTKIKSLEDLVIKLGYDPTDVKSAEEIIESKNADIDALRKQLKLPTT